MSHRVITHRPKHRIHVATRMLASTALSITLVWASAELVLVPSISRAQSIPEIADIDKEFEPLDLDGEFRLEDVEPNEALPVEPDLDLELESEFNERVQPGSPKTSSVEEKARAQIDPSLAVPVQNVVTEELPAQLSLPADPGMDVLPLGAQVAAPANIETENAEPPTQQPVANDAERVEPILASKEPIIEPLSGPSEIVENIEPELPETGAVEDPLHATLDAAPDIEPTLEEAKKAPQMPMPEDGSVSNGLPLNLAAETEAMNEPDIMPEPEIAPLAEEDSLTLPEIETIADIPEMEKEIGNVPDIAQNSESLPSLDFSESESFDELPDIEDLDAEIATSVDADTSAPKPPQAEEVAQSDERDGNVKPNIQEVETVESESPPQIVEELVLEQEPDIQLSDDDPIEMQLESETEALANVEGEHNITNEIEAEIENTDTHDAEMAEINGYPIPASKPNAPKRRSVIASRAESDVSPKSTFAGLFGVASQSVNRTRGTSQERDWKNDPSANKLPDSTVDLIEKLPSGITSVDSDDEIAGGPIAIKRDESQGSVFPEEGYQEESPVGMSISVRNDDETIEDILEHAYNALVMGQMESSIQLYMRVLEIESDNRLALFGLATAFQRNKQRYQAQTVYEEIFRLYPDYQEALNNFLVLVGEESPEQALVELEKLAERNPNFSPLQAQMGMLHMQLQNYQLAATKLARAISLSPENIMYRYNLAIAMDMLGDHEEASSLYDQVLTASKRGTQLPISVAEIQERLTFYALNSGCEIEAVRL